jgi:hypothetical protein
MKNFKLLVPILIALFLAACGEKKQKIENTSPDKAIHILVEGMKPNALDPWRLDFKIKAGEKAGSIATEFHASDITAENVKFNWLEVNYCQVTLIEQDGIERNFLVRVDQDGIKIQEQEIKE